VNSGAQINSDVCGPDDPGRVVRLAFHDGDVRTRAVDLTVTHVLLVAARPPS
jgi:hypothetical protein